ncbi:MAG: citrate lyase subunit alpha [Candidatus Izemoplasmatales bacterium]|nr:citrate lyase subunit alpha [Candidatus Izemoplasmatales bacterium]
MKNLVDREISKDLRPYGEQSLQKSNHLSKKQTSTQVEFFSSYKEAFDFFSLKDGITVSFHHHLRSGDGVINDVCQEIRSRDFQHVSLMPSSIFPTYQGIAQLIREHRVNNIITSYCNGEVSKLVQQGLLQGDFVMQTHGGRARSIMTGERKIDVAFLACPTVDKSGNGSGMEGKSACGVLGYAISDLEYAKKVILVTDHLVESLDQHQLDGKYVDGVIVVDSIGDPQGIVSGTTRITRDSIGLKIAKDTTKLLDALGLIEDGFSMQTGAGGTSLAVAAYVKELMKQKQIRARFCSGGITSYFVEMLEEGLVDKLLDVQCFDLEAVRSSKENKNHIAISASVYGNPDEANPVSEQLDFVILGATEIDLNFNVNVTTDSFGAIIGGSGGHSDIARGAFVTVVVSSLVKSRLPILRESIRTITTPGCDIDLFVTERGVAVNPLRTDLIQKLDQAGIAHWTMPELLQIAHEMTGVPRALSFSNQVIGYVEYRDGSVIDMLYQEGFE